MTATAVVMERTRAMLMASQRDVVNSLAVDLNVSATILTVTVDASSITTGSWLDVDAESMIVTGVSGLTITVIRAQRGSTAQVHATGATIRVNPRFHGSDIFDAINATLGHLCAPSSGLFRPEIISLSNTGKFSLSLEPATELLDVRSVIFKASADYYATLRGWRIQRHPLSATFPAGIELKLTQAAYTGPIEVTCATEFLPMADTNDDVEGTSGLAASAVPLLVIGAALYLIQGREVARNFFETQGDTRRANEVPTGSQTNSMTGLRVQYAQKLAAESNRLSVQYPKVLR